MTDRAAVLTKHLKAHDAALFCRGATDGKLRVYRKTVRWERHAFMGGTLSVSLPDRHLILALTDTWTAAGTPRDWGIEPVMARIKEIDLWRDDTLVDRLIDGYDRHARSQGKKVREDAAAFLGEFRPKFARAFNDVNTATLEKVDRRRGNHGSK